MRRRSREWTTEPQRSLERLRELGTWVHVEEPGGQPRHGRSEPDTQVAWWWHRGARTVVVGRGVLSILGAIAVDGTPLRFREAAQVVLVGFHGPSPGDVRRKERVDLVLDPPVPAWSTRPAPPPEPPPGLAPLLGRTVEVITEGGQRVEHRGMLVHPDAGEPTSRTGRLEAAVAGGGHLVLVLADLTVVVVHEPLDVEARRDGEIAIVGDLGRVVLDLAAPAPEAVVLRDAALVVRPLADDAAPTSAV